ncbi:NAD(P)-dependent oxidoreductase [Streptomyces sp. NBC_00243]|uniref:NAD-dependent epimerase/dehydratase family protein n=1 Tax=Streptomyces sp. NBC_00243 TaxID=2975688 RepID=UPI002DDB7C4E|nr:NAD(P)-dependent oxidoreductase [Streptomyces sp. NBC_00243]WRZ22990.1 NAD(P)-dependent oxidoreductase [Streptomyces sp. NBC_00243]
MRILVLGSTGFLGGHVAVQLRTLAGVRVLGGGRSVNPGLPVNLPVDLAAISVAGLARSLRALAPDAVVNCAGAVGGDPVRMADTNARGPAVLCEALREAAPGARLVHLGSAAEYGPTPAGQTLTESSPASPQGTYGATKLAGSYAVTEAGAAGLDTVVLRVFNPVGPGAPAAGLSGRLAGELRRAGPDGTVRVGDLSAYRDFVDVRDVARAAVLAATATGPLPSVLNIGSGTATCARDLASELARAAGFQGRIEERGAGSQRSSAVSWQRADVTAAAAALDWRPELTLADSLTGLWAEHTRVPA